MRGQALVMAMVLAGCSAGDHWAKPGADRAIVEQAYEECRVVAAEVVAPEIGINQDILATRQTDWQRSQIGRVENRIVQEQTRKRAEDIVTACMRAKGYASQP